MTFDEAAAACQPGQYFKSATAGWNEHHIQYGRGAEDEALFWTAGLTCGGEITPKFEASAKQCTDYRVHEFWQDTDWIKLHKARKEREADLKELQERRQGHQRTHFLEKVMSVTDTAAAMAIIHGVPRRTADLVTTTLTKDILHILDGDSKHPGYRLSQRTFEMTPNPDRYVGEDLSGSLEHYFDEINS